MAGALAPLGEGFRPLISAVLRDLGAAPDEGATTDVIAWLDLLATWNAKIDLTAARSAEELVDLMLADAVVLARHEKPGSSVVDVGSGAGGPGLALGLLRPDLALSLVEPLAKRVAFLRTVIGHLAAAPHRKGAARVIRAKGEELAARGEVFDVAIARATLPPAAWLDLGARLVRPGGTVWVLLAREPAPETTAWEIATEERYTWPLTGAERRALRYIRAR
jgi:16S rRNA (guanine527-N7)-methyltransferase